MRSWRSALLSEDDLGSGWVAQPTEGATVAENYYCGTKIASLPQGALAVFANEEQGRAVIEALGTFPDATSAVAYLQTVRDAHANCSDVRVDRRRHADGMAHRSRSAPWTSATKRSQSTRPWCRTSGSMFLF